MAAAEERPDYLSAFRPDTPGEVIGAQACRECYLQASPDVGDVRILGPGPRGEAFQYQCAELVGERQLAPQRLAVQPAQFQCDHHGRARQRELQAKNLSSEEIFP